MVEVKFNICDKVYFLNTATWTIESDTVKGVQIVPTGISKSESGEDVLDGSQVLYMMNEFGALASDEVFSTEDEVKNRVKALIESWS